MKTVASSVVLLLLTVGLLFGQVSPYIKIVTAARSQVGTTVRYDPDYQKLAYPNGDVSIDSGVCTDVIIRALRTALGMDLQQLVHEDMKANFRKYPQIWGLRGPDKNIDHRRVPNLRTYFKRQGYEVPVTKDSKDYQPGDLVTCIVPPHLPHITLVSDRTNHLGCPLIIHNIGSGAQEEDRLFEFELTGHYRLNLIEPQRGAEPSSAGAPEGRTR